MNFEEKLIIAIQDHPCLFNKRSISYRKRAVKRKAWSNVAADIGSDVKECQHRWRSLRDRYVRAVRAKPNCKWRYMSQLTFLNPHLDSRNNSTNSNADLMTDEESCSNSDAYTNFEYEEKKNILEEQEQEKAQEGPEMPIPKFEGKIEIDADKEEVIEIQDETSFAEFPSDSPSTAITMICEAKKIRLDSMENNERLGMEPEVNSAEIVNVGKSRNEDYYKTLDSYMLQLPLNVQDDLKIELLNRVYNEIKRHF